MQDIRHWIGCMNVATGSAATLSRQLRNANEGKTRSGWSLTKTSMQTN